jgi:hypothetical protein
MDIEFLSVPVFGEIFSISFDFEIYFITVAAHAVNTCRK